MVLPLDRIIQLLEESKYLLLFPISIMEGPIVSILAGFISSLGKMNPFIATGIVILGDLTGDTAYYLIGRYGRKGIILKYGRFLGITEANVNRMDDHFEKNTGKTLLFGKFAHALGTPILFAAGIAKVPFGRFLLYNFVGTVPKSAVLVLIGYYFGSSYQKINGYFDNATYIGIGIAVVLVIAYVLFTRYAREKV